MRHPSDRQYPLLVHTSLEGARSGAAAGRSAAEIVAAYTFPDRYSDFAAPTGRLEQIVPLMLEGR